jgi:hypothetical protein
MTGMLHALSSMDKGGDLFMFTDASPKDAGLAGNVSSVAETNEVTIDPVLFGSCPPGSAMTARSTIDPAYERVAADTGGQVFVLSRAEAGQITKLADFVARANNVDLLAVAGDLSAGAKTFSVPVDSTMTQVTFSASGAANVVVTRPDGTVVKPGDPGVKVVSLTSGLSPATLVSIATPSVGAWKVALSGPSTYSLTVSGESSLDLSSFHFLHEIAGHEGPFDVPIPGFPAPETASTVQAELTGPFSTARFDFRSADGTVLKTLALTPVASPAVGEFSGDVTPGATPFRVYVTGTDTAGNAFQRALPSTIRPQQLAVSPPEPGDLHPGRSSSFAFTVKNLGAPDTFRVSVSDDKGFLQTFSPSNLTLATNETGTVTVQVQPPASATDGTSDTLSVDVESIANPAVSNFAVLTNPVVATPPDTIPPTTTATITPAPNAAGWNNTDPTVTLHAVDNDGGSGVKSITYSATGAQPIGETTATGDTVSVPITAEGTTTLTFSSVDNAGNSEAPRSVKIQLDKTPPSLTCRAFPATLWPPNHKLVPVRVLVKFTDALSGIDAFQLISLTANQPITPDDVAGFTIGKPDVLGLLRAERDGYRADRIYTLTYQGNDVAGNTASCSTDVTVPHDQHGGADEAGQDLGTRRASPGFSLGMIVGPARRS